MVFPLRAHPRPLCLANGSSGKLWSSWPEESEAGVETAKEEEIEGKILESREPQQGSKVSRDSLL